MPMRHAHGAGRSGLGCLDERLLLKPYRGPRLEPGLAYGVTRNS